jgi:hypothetical protein
LPSRAPSMTSRHVRSGRVLTLDFGMPTAGSKSVVRSHNTVDIPSGKRSRSPSIPANSSLSNMNISSGRSPEVDTQRFQLSTTTTPVATKCDTPPSSDLPPLSPPPDVSTGSVSAPSLGDQYLDTMIQDDRWRHLCLQQIRESRRIARKKRLSLPVKVKSRVPVEDLTPLTPPVSPKSCVPGKSDDEDSGFHSGSPGRKPGRTTRRCPPQEELSSGYGIEVRRKMVGRSCLSCGCTSTTCWRRSLDGVICNSCGLRYTRDLCALI